MSFAQALIAEFDHEMGTTRRVLARVPAENPDWTPHVKSRSMKALAQHVAQIPLFGHTILTTAEWDMVLNRAERPSLNGAAELVPAFDEAARALRQLIVDKTDGEMLAVWTFKRDGKPIVSMPKGMALRSMVLNHLIHHRGQLSVYLRLNDIPIPPMYGPTADEAV